MIDIGLISVVVSGLVSFCVAIAVTWWKGIYIFKEQIAYSRNKELIEKRLNNLYSPLYFYILRAEQTTGKSIIMWTSPAGEKGQGREKGFLDNIIEKNSHLASEELQKLLAKAHGVYVYRMKEEDIEKLVELIKKEYKELRDELFNLKSNI